MSERIFSSNDYDAMEQALATKMHDIKDKLMYTMIENDDASYNHVKEVVFRLTNIPANLIKVYIDADGLLHIWLDRPDRKNNQPVDELAEGARRTMQNFNEFCKKHPMPTREETIAEMGSKTLIPLAYQEPEFRDRSEVDIDAIEIINKCKEMISEVKGVPVERVRSFFKFGNIEFGIVEV